MNGGTAFFASTVGQSRFLKNGCPFRASKPPVSFVPIRFVTSRSKNFLIISIKSGDSFDNGSTEISSCKIAFVNPSFVFALNGRYN